MEKLPRACEFEEIGAAGDGAQRSACCRAAQTTVLELQQTTVEKLKEASADGKLSKDEIDDLGKRLVDSTLAKMSDAAKGVLDAAGVLI